MCLLKQAILASFFNKFMVLLKNGAKSWPKKATLGSEQK
jgi:hypothetical protein